MAAPRLCSGDHEFGLHPPKAKTLGLFGFVFQPRRWKQRPDWVCFVIFYLPKSHENKIADLQEKLDPRSTVETALWRPLGAL
jgi:hypothetical protein